MKKRNGSAQEQIKLISRQEEKKVKNKLKITAALLAGVMLLNEPLVAIAGEMVEDYTQQDLIFEYVGKLSSGDLEGVADLKCDEEKGEYLEFATDEYNVENHIG